MSENKKIEKIVGVKGMNDILPADAPLWELFENTVHSVLKSYGFQCADQLGRAFAQRHL